jgi:hypothetical protein
MPDMRESGRTTAATAALTDSSDSDGCNISSSSSWIEDKDLGNGPVEELDPKEENFFLVSFF